MNLDYEPTGDQKISGKTLQRSSRRGRAVWENFFLLLKTMLISLSRMPLLGLYKLSANLDDGCTSNNDAAVDSRGILRVGVGHYGYTDGLQTAYDPADQCKCFLAHNF